MDTSEDKNVASRAFTALGITTSFTSGPQTRRVRREVLGEGR